MATIIYHNHDHDQHRMHYDSYLIHLIYFLLMILIAFLHRYGQYILLRFDSDWNPQVRSLSRHSELCAVGTCLSLHARSFDIYFLSLPSPFLSCPLLSCPLFFFPLLSFPLLSSPFLSFPLLSSPLLSSPLLSSPLLSSPLFSSPLLPFCYSTTPHSHI